MHNLLLTTLVQIQPYLEEIKNHILSSIQCVRIGRSCMLNRKHSFSFSGTGLACGHSLDKPCVSTSPHRGRFYIISHHSTTSSLYGLFGDSLIFLS